LRFICLLPKPGGPLIRPRLPDALVNPSLLPGASSLLIEAFNNNCHYRIFFKTYLKIIRPSSSPEESIGGGKSAVA
jgi:hypothetical protein